MNVSRILAEKGRNVVTAGPHRTIREIATELMRHGIGAIVIVDDDHNVVGLIAERDIVAAVAVRGADALDDAVSVHMHANPISAQEADTIDATMQTMTIERRRHLPVICGGRLCGVVSIGDVVKHRIRVIEDEYQAMREYIAQA